MSAVMRRLPPAASLVLALLAVPAHAAAPAAGTVLTADYPRLQALYEDMHRNPETGFQETRTAARLAREMRALGFEVTEHVGGTGVVAVYRNGPGPAVMVRTELDGLPMAEKTGLAYASKAVATVDGVRTPVAHACGHDIHMAAWVGAAQALVARKDQWSGVLVFVAQPDEEGDRGARAMLADGLFTRFPKPDYALALHVTPAAYGTIGYRAGPAMAASDTLEIVFHGRGGHGAAPQLTIDSIMVAARFVVDLQAVLGREKDPSEFGVVSIGAIHGGSAGNIIPDTVSLAGTVRSYSPAVRDVLIRGVERTARASADMAGAPAPQVTVRDGLGPVVNDVALTTRLAGVLTAAFGDRVSVNPPITGSEDFSEYGKAGVRSFYFTIGGADPARVAAAAAGGAPVPGNHSPLFAPTPEPTIRTGVEAMTRLALDLLRR